jgi:hypothetical protein
LVDFWKAHFAFVQVKARPLLLLRVGEVFCEFLDEGVPNQLYVVIYRVEGIDPGPYISGPGSDLWPLDEGERDGNLSNG